MGLTFVVGTGRCGSTLVSRMLHEHPDVLSLSELFSTIHAREIWSGEPDGRRFWSLLSEPDPVIDSFVLNGLRLVEYLYPYGTGRFDPADGVPAICHMTLPMLTADADALHDALADELPRWPARPVAEQYRALFAWLSNRFGRSTVVERSGASLAMVPRLRSLFPEARFVYLARDGVDSALSMSTHAGFRLLLLGREAARLAGVATADDIGPQHVNLLPPRLSRALSSPLDPRLVMDEDISLTAVCAMWSVMTCEGVAALADLPAECWTTLRYEELLRDPAGQLHRLSDFLGVRPDGEWLRRAAAQVDSARVPASSRLEPRRLAALRRACAPGAVAESALELGPVTAQ